MAKTMANVLDKSQRAGAVGSVNSKKNIYHDTGSRIKSEISGDSNIGEALCDVRTC